MKRKEKEKKSRPPKIRQTTKDIMGNIRYEEEHGCFISNGYYIGILQIRSKDLMNASDDEIEYDILKYAKLYKVVSEDIKIISMNFPCSTERQREYLKRLALRTKNPLYLQEIERKIKELEAVEKTKTSREYILMIYSQSLEEFLKTKIRIQQTLQQGKTSMTFEPELEKQVTILYKMNNKNRISK
jgi:hypothetical protein